jgi:alkanesulfonate monooxygenase SsuD/methylene tetrahydromethanopterin reductase-like flavin-dependent oxidoreductase (luciferase family)
MQFGIYVPNFGAYGDPHNLLTLAAEAETAGWDGFFLWDHLLIFSRAAVPFVDAWVALAAIATRTERMRLGPMITPVARRRPWKLARELVSLDHLSRGRAVLGVGLGNPADVEFQYFGEDPADRVRARKLDEALGIVDGLQRGESFQHDGEYFHLEAMTFLPRPVQTPRVPVWVAGNWPNKLPMRRAARWDGVFPLKQPSSVSVGSMAFSDMWLAPTDLREIVAFVRQHRTTEGHFDVVASGATPVNEPAHAREVVAAFQEVGATWWLEWLDEQRGTFAKMREHIQQGPPRI